MLAALARRTDRQGQSLTAFESSIPLSSVSQPNFSFADHDKLVRKLVRLGDLDDDDMRQVQALPISVRLVSADRDIVAEGARSTDCALVLDGLACRQKVMANGTRQILSLHVPGDIVDLQRLHLDTPDHGICAVTACRIGFIPRAALQALIMARPKVASLLWRDTLIDASVGRAWLTSVGRRTAYQRIAHLLCELFIRLSDVGLADQDGFELPLTQTGLGDALGLTAVHVNRVLQELRKQGIIASQGRALRILDWAALQRAGDFDPGYLRSPRSGGDGHGQ